ncbi:glycosyltransferase family 2 protein [Nonomuraea typhae]|uniref:Glycosyltransferase family 2 protein n=1 Tax=Nonomuraea typhae TaxID=2603600 RepID=A0ABW7YQK8_9ACTN
MTVPDVSVIIAVYNTMPHLRECLDSVMGQSIGASRLEVIAVDDGSTDGSAQELDDFAARYPGTVKVLRQANSGGPAAPSNRALEQATGRYVYFVGADDFLAEQALERLVRAADAYDSDVVLGRMVGANGRQIPQKVYAETRMDIGLFDSPLPYSLSNTKLFRRSLIEDHGLRFPEDMPIFSDQPFTLAAFLHARRVSVLADYVFYYAVSRDNGDNITSRASPLSQLRGGEQVIEHVVRLLPPGAERDFVLKRHFGYELAKLLRAEFLTFTEDEQKKICESIAHLCTLYLTPGLRAQLTSPQRYRLTLAARGDRETLCRSLREEADGVQPPILVRGQSAYSQGDGFGDLPDDCFELTGNLAGRLAAGVEISSIGWQRARLHLAGQLCLTGAEAKVTMDVVPAGTARALRQGRRLKADDGAAGRAPGQVAGDFRFDVEARSLLRKRAPRYSVRLYTDVAGSTYELPVPLSQAPEPVRTWYRGRPYRIRARANEHGHLTIVAVPLPLWQAVRDLFRGKRS